MDNLTLHNEIIAVSRIDFNGEEWNYIVLSKDNIVNNEQTYKVQWWSKSMNYYWSKYNMSFTNALNRFYLKVKPNIYNIVSNINEKTNKIDYKSQFNELQKETDLFRNYMCEKMQDYINLIKSDMFSIDDVEELLNEIL